MSDSPGRREAWFERDFAALWAGQTVSLFGSLLTRTALPFTAILLLRATPMQMSLLTAADLVPALLLGLIAGAWIDRLRRRPILIATDLLRAALLVSIPVLALAGRLHFAHLCVVALLAGACTLFFDVAYHAYLPTLVPRERLLECNRRMAASGSVAEVAAFGSGGWLVQWLGAPVALLIDAATFLFSALSLRTIRAPEPAPPAGERPALRAEIRDGLAGLARDPRLRAIGAAAITSDLSFGMSGALYMLFVTDALGFRPGTLGMIFALGGVSSLLGALVADRVARRVGVGPAMTIALLVGGLAALLVPAARGASALAMALLVTHQLVGDGAVTIYTVHETSLRQSLAPEALRGRVHGTLRFLGVAAMIAGSLAAGWIATTAGLRAALVTAAVVRIAAALRLFASPAWRIRSH